MHADLHDINTRLSDDPAALCSALGLSSKKRGYELVVDLGVYGKGILPLKGAKKGIVLFTAGGPNDKQGGNMLTLIWAVHRTFPNAVAWAKTYLGIDAHTQEISHCFSENKMDRSYKYHATNQKKPEQEDKLSEKKIQLVQTCWMAGSDIKGTLADTYLRSRGLPHMDWGDQVRFNPACIHQTTGLKRPALMACVRDESGRIMGLKNIFLNSETGGKSDITPNKPSMGFCSGGAVQLYPVMDDGILALAEGVETAFAVRAFAQLKGQNLPCWSVLSAGGFLSFKPPQNVRKIFLYPDGDLPRRLPNGLLARGVGIVSCEKAASSFDDMGLETTIAPVPTAGRDWLDVYMDIKGDNMLCGA